MKVRPWTILALVILCTGLLRIRLLEAPLERDEGEYAYAGQLMLQGIPPYQLACNMKLPGTYAAYAAILAAFGQTIAGIHLGLLLVNAVTIALVYLLGRRLFGTSQGLAACAVYALMSFGEGVMGTQAHATHFVVLPALAGVLLLLRHTETGSALWLWASGLLFGLAFVMKQHGVLFGIFGALYLAVGYWRRPRALLVRLIAFLCAAAAPFAVTCLLLWHAGVFGKFWFWTFAYARAYASESSLSDGLTAFWDNFVPIVQENAGLWILAAAGLVLMWWKKEDRRSAVFALALLVFSFLAISPGLYFRGHYFVLLLPAAALLAGYAIRNRWSYAVFGAALLFSFYTQRQFLFHMTPLEVCRDLYGTDPFPEAIPVSEYIRTHSARQARIAVLGSEPEIYFYADRHSATTYVYMYALMEPQPYALAMQDEVIHELETTAPEFVVWQPDRDRWQQEPGSPTRIFEWWAAYGPRHYQLVGVADTISDERTEYRWGADAEAYQPKSEEYLAIYRRKDAPASVAAR